MLHMKLAFTNQTIHIYCYRIFPSIAMYNWNNNPPPNVGNSDLFVMAFYQYKKSTQLHTTFFLNILLFFKT